MNYPHEISLSPRLTRPPGHTYKPVSLRATPPYYRRRVTLGDCILTAPDKKRSRFPPLSAVLFGCRHSFTSLAVPTLAVNTSRRPNSSMESSPTKNTMHRKAH